MYVTAKDDDIKLGKISKYITYMTYSLRINVQVKKKSSVRTWNDNIKNIILIYYIIIL